MNPLAVIVLVSLGFFAGVAFSCLFAVGYIRWGRW
jgi:hypothetical protein